MPPRPTERTRLAASSIYYSIRSSRASRATFRAARMRTATIRAGRRRLPPAFNWARRPTCSFRVRSSTRTRSGLATVTTGIRPGVSSKTRMPPPEARRRIIPSICCTRTWFRTRARWTASSPSPTAAGGFSTRTATRRRSWSAAPPIRSRNRLRTAAAARTTATPAPS